MPRDPQFFRMFAYNVSEEEILWQAACNRAEELLLEHLKKQQQVSLRHHDFFDFKGSHGHTYRIFRRGNLAVAMDRYSRGEFTGICVNLARIDSGTWPPAARALGIKLAIEANEPYFWQYGVMGGRRDWKRIARDTWYVDF